MGERKAPKSGQKQTMNQQIGRDAQAPPAHPGRMEAELQDHIGRELRALYEEVLEEPVPDRFKQLLDDLERKQVKP